jgi:putative colanic acid biosynthesis UDP-glucose lipid carrier transferase
MGELGRGKGYLKERMTVIQLFVRLLDIFSVVLAFYAAHIVMFGHPRLYLGYQVGLAACIAIILLVFPFFGLYRSWRTDSFIKEASSILLAWITSGALLVGFAFLLKSSDVFSRLWFAYFTVMGLTSLLLVRAVVRMLVKMLRARGYNKKYIFVVGADTLAQRTIDMIEKSPWLGLEISGVFANEVAVDDLKCMHCGGIDAFTERLSHEGVDQIWLALPFEKMSEIKDYYEQACLFGKEIKLVPDLLEMELLNHSVGEINGLPVLHIINSPMQGINALIKRLEDIILSAAILLLILPLMLLIAIAIKVTSRGPVFYLQERVSWNGKLFNMLKFRSMEVDSEGETLHWGGAREKQVTAIGKLLRETSLDELPQFINVMKGDMSIVGPRPERTVFVQKFKTEIPRYMHKHMVKAGITGWAQINGWRGDTDLNERIECDLHYIENWSLLLDLKIIILTIFKGFVDKSAY